MGERGITGIARLSAAAAILLALGLFAPAFAQSDASEMQRDRLAVPKPDRDPKACAEPVMPGSQASRQTTGEALGEKLARTDGVICPPAGIDSEIRVPAPDTGVMPVIPPPGSPGGDPTVRPK
jgi:hypothetical protein